jgi:hypothetical protein
MYAMLLSLQEPFKFDIRNRLEPLEFWLLGILFALLTSTNFSSATELYLKSFSIAVSAPTLTC